MKEPLPTAEERVILRRRAERLRSAEDEVAREETGLAVAVFRIGEDRFGIAMSQMRAVVPLRLVTPVPLAPPSVIGVLRFDGQVVTAHSLAALLGVRGWRHDPEVLVIVETGQGMLAALDCEQVPAAETLPITAMSQATPAGSSPWVEVPTAGGELLHMVDLARLLGRRG